MVLHLSPRGADLAAWWPAVGGSVRFLVASNLAWAEVRDSAGRLRFDDVSCGIVLVNLAGSVLFAVGAIAWRVALETGELLDSQLMDTATLLAATCFLVGALLLVPEARRGLAG